MNIVIPVLIKELSSLELIMDQLYVTIESYYFFGNTGQFIIFTNAEAVIKGIQHLNEVYNFKVKTEKIDFIKEWEALNLRINPIKTRKDFIIAKMLIPFIFEEDFLLIDWDILTTGYIDNRFLKSDKLRFFNPKMYDGLTLRNLSLCKGYKPLEEDIGKFRWVNSGLAYLPYPLTKNLILEYWDKFDSITEKEYKGIILFDIIGDELIYNLMMLDKRPEVEEFRDLNINIVSRNFYYSFKSINSMDNFGKNYPYIMNFHFAVGHVKPFNITIDDEGTLHYEITLHKYNQDPDLVNWCLDMGQHRIGSHHYNALVFGIIWQYRRYLIKETMNLTTKIESKKYLDFFNESIIHGQ